MFTHILIPIDDDPGSRHAIKLGVALAKKIDARVTGFHAMTEFNHAGIVEARHAVSIDGGSAGHHRSRPNHCQVKSATRRRAEWVFSTQRDSVGDNER